MKNLCLWSSFFLLSFLVYGCKGSKGASSTSRVAKPFLNAQNVVIYENNGEEYGPSEPSICISRNNPNHIIAGSVLDFVHSSSNGGRSWTTKKLQSQLGVYGDPCIVSDADGNFYYFHLGDPSMKGWKGDRILESIVVQKSKSNGIIWSDGKEIGKNPPKQQDKEWAAVNYDKEHIVVTWTEFDKYGDESPSCHTSILSSFSSDQGETWSTPTQVSEHEGNCKDDDQTTEGAVPAFGPEGELYVAYAFDEKIYCDRSMDGGKTWLEKDIVVTEQPGGWSFKLENMPRVNGLPVTAVDRSREKYEGRVYVNYATGGIDPDIKLVYSDDQGQSWSQPMTVNQSKDGSAQFFTWMAIDQKTGGLYFVYYDCSGFEDGSFHTKLAYSLDGGQTFSEHIISAKPSKLPRDVFFGDYNNIDVFAGKIRPIWTHFDGKKLSVLTALIDLNK